MHGAADDGSGSGIASTVTDDPVEDHQLPHGWSPRGSTSTGGGGWPRWGCRPYSTIGLHLFACRDCASPCSASCRVSTTGPSSGRPRCAAPCPTAETRILRADDGSWVEIDNHAASHQSGPRSIGDEILAAYRAWVAHGRPDRSRYGLTVTPTGTSTVWLDSPEEPAERIATTVS